VDDEANILKAVCRLFKGEPFEVHTADSGPAALEFLESGSVQVIVSDQRMPGMTGVDLLSRIREQWPDIVRIMITGNTEMKVAVEAINRGEIYRMLTKPWTDEEMRATVKEALHLYSLKSEIKRLNLLTREQNSKLHDLNKNLERKVGERTQEISQKNLELSFAYVNTIKALAGAIDAKDQYTGGHSARVGMYAGMIAKRMGLEESRLRRVYIAGILHDIGKIGIRENVLLKPGRLTREEYEEMKRHPILSAQILRPVPWLQDVVPAIRHHHEWFNGDRRGYPDQLKGDSIDLGARIILVADTIDAMTTNRPYRNALPVEKVTRELSVYRATQFDPDVADAALALFEERGDAFFQGEDEDAFLQPERAFLPPSDYADEPRASNGEILVASSEDCRIDVS
jgi:response regulator RpfG family c-di-GMP phosphodiesterase